MHIPDGMLPINVAVAGYLLAGGTVWYSLKKINQKEDPRREIPKVALLTAAFFVAALIRIPIPPASVHITLIGLLGSLLGVYAFPAILIALFFQAVMFQQGGLTTLGVNALIMGLPALLAFYAFSQVKRFFGKDKSFKTGVLGFLPGIIGAGGAVALFYFIILTFLPAEIDLVTEQAAVYALTLAHIPVVLLEGVFTAFVLVYLNRVKPEMLGD